MKTHVHHVIVDGVIRLTVNAIHVLTFQNVMHYVWHQSINNMEVLTLVEDGVIRNAISCRYVAS